MIDWLQVLFSLSIVPVAFFFQVCQCCSNPCVSCAVGTSAHNTVQVIVSGITNGTCGTCTTLNGTYILTQTAANGCIWDITVPIVCARYVVISSTLGAGTVTGLIRNSLGNNFLRWGPVSNAGFNNCDWSSFSITNPNNSGVVDCNNSAATFVITAL
jgi:hypothetical protein